MTGCRFQDIWKDQCETARGVPEHLTALAELRTTKLAGGDIHLPTYSRPTRSGSANVDSSSAISRSSTAMYLEELPQRLQAHQAPYALGHLSRRIRLWGFQVTSSSRF
jgi:hypothetical protein